MTVEEHVGNDVTRTRSKKLRTTWNDVTRTRSSPGRVTSFQTSGQGRKIHPLIYLYNLCLPDIGGGPPWLTISNTLVKRLLIPEVISGDPENKVLLGEKNKIVLVCGQDAWS